MYFPQDAANPPLIADENLARLGTERWLDKAQALDDGNLAGFMADVACHPVLQAAFGNSPFLTSMAVFEPAFARLLLEQGPDQAYAQVMEQLWADADGETDMARLMKLLRIAKRKVALCAGLADIAGIWALEPVTVCLSDFAERAIRLSLRFLLRRDARLGEYTLPNPDDPEDGSGLVVLGMGKFGARELNYSSDIDLIVFYDHEALDYQGRRSLPECMIRMTRDLVKLLDEYTEHGYVFRTDLRLRPDPGSTPVAISLVAAEAYYEGFGQNWERAAMIKARQVGGDAHTGAQFLKFLRPFIWRKNLDFAAISDIHSIKRQINAHRGGRSIKVAGHNIKLGRGGIREIEFFVQTQQLIWGGRETSVRTNRTLDGLVALSVAGHVAPDVAAEMDYAYRFLRGLEHRLQMIDDKQTQTLPEQPERLTALAVFYGFADLEAFSQALLKQLFIVEAHYGRLFENAPDLGTCGNLVFTGGENDPETMATLTQMGFGKADAICSTIRGWHHGRIRATRSTRARELLTELTPALLKALAGTAAPDEAFLRFDEFLSRLPAGVALFSLIYANPSLLDLLAEILGNAPRLAEYLARHSHLLDAVVSAKFFETPPPLEQQAASLTTVLADSDDIQDVLDTSRRWANDRRFQVGVQVLRGLLTPTQAALAFTDIADAVLIGMAPKVEDELARIHGRIPGGRWCVLAMGKMGGREMTATSDLDLIVVYDAPADAEESDGSRPLAVAPWFARLTQRLVNALSAKTAEGELYEVDMRLRPSGNSGPIACSLESFQRYQAESAWTWEHMALTRARVVCGAPDLAKRIDEVIRQTLTTSRDAAKLVMDVAEMRERMAREHKGTNPWEVKHRRGGLVDIEFIAQYLQLRHGADHPQILAVNTRQVLERAHRAGLLAAADMDALIEAWSLWSATQLILRQTIAGAFDDASAPTGLREVLVRAVGLIDFKTLRDRMDDCAKSAFDLFENLVGVPGRAERERIGPDA